MFTEKARRVVFFARYEATVFHSSSIETEHIMLGILQELDKNSNLILAKVGVNTKVLRDHLIYNLTKEKEGLAHDNINDDIPIHSDVKRIFQCGNYERKRLNHDKIDIEHLILGILRELHGTAGRLLKKAGANAAIAKKVLLDTNGVEVVIQNDNKHPLLTEFAKNLSELVKHNDCDRLIGRTIEIDRIVQIMSCRRKNNPILLGESGVGKTAIIEGLAQNIYNGNVPKNLKNKIIYEIDISLVIAGTKYRGQFEERMKAIIREASEDPNVVLFIDEIHNITGAGAIEGGLNAANILKPALSRGDLQCIGATTHKEFAKYVSKDRGLTRRFQPVNIAPTTEAETINILSGIQNRYELFHNVRYHPEAIRAAVYLSNRYINDRCLPDKAIDLLDEAGAKVKLRQINTNNNNSKTEGELQQVIYEKHTAIKNQNFEQAIAMHQKEENLRSVIRGNNVKDPGEDSALSIEVCKSDIEDIVACRTGIQTGALKSDDKVNLTYMESHLNKHIIGQAEAISAVSRAIRRARTGVKNPNRPTGSFIFLGPTGVGKTALAKTLADFLFGNQKKMIRFDMSEFMEKCDISKLLGAPPGYVGHEEGGVLTDQVRRNPYCVILFDEIEKAHADITNILLQILDDGIVTDAFGNLVDFKKTIIIMTSNIGSNELSANKNLGFIKNDSSTSNRSINTAKALKRKYPPEFLNRIDEIVIFNGLSNADLHKIILLFLDELNNTLKQHNLFVTITDKGCDWLVDTTAKDRSYGARPLRRAIQQYVEDPIADLIITNANTSLVGMVNFELVNNQLIPRCITK
jgi:ATP-dependent Clp protease ATP-binding subunit ClpC